MESNANAREVQVDTDAVDVLESQFSSKRRSKVWIHFLSLNSAETKDGKERAICKYCKTASFISNSHYGTSNMQKHLEKCKHYTAHKKSLGNDGEEPEHYVYDQKVYRELVATAIIKHGYAFSWVQHEVILDPRYKLSFLKYCYEIMFEDEIEASLKINDVRFKLGMLFKEYSPVSHGTSDSNFNFMSTSSSDHKRKFDRFADYDKREATSSCAKSQLDIYLDDPKMDRKVELDILNFWKENEHRYGELSHLARDILTVPLTTVASESTFSIRGRILNKWRSSYIPENVEALITTRSWLFGYESMEDEEFVGSSVDLNEKKSNC